MSLTLSDRSSDGVLLGIGVVVPMRSMVSRSLSAYAWYLMVRHGCYRISSILLEFRTDVTESSSVSFQDDGGRSLRRQALC